MRPEGPAAGWSERVRQAGGAPNVQRRYLRLGRCRPQLPAHAPGRLRPAPPVAVDPRTSTGTARTRSSSPLYTQMDAKARRAGFIVATPDGIDNQFDYTAPSVDFTFTEDLVRYLDSILCISPTKRFSTGMSNGGAMSGAVACLPELHLRAIAGVTAMLPACDNGTKMPVLYFHGNADPVVNYAVAGPVIASWAARDGCDATPRGDPHRAGHPEADVHRLRRRHVGDALHRRGRRPHVAGRHHRPPAVRPDHPHHRRDRT